MFITGVFAFFFTRFSLLFQIAEYFAELTDFKSQNTACIRQSTAISTNIKICPGVLTS